MYLKSIKMPVLTDRYIILQNSKEPELIFHLGLPETSYLNASFELFTSTMP